MKTLRTALLLACHVAGCWLLACVVGGAVGVLVGVGAGHEAGRLTANVVGVLVFLEAL